MMPEPSTLKEEREAIAKMVFTLFEHWNLGTDEQLGMLGLPPSNRSLLSRYRNGDPLAPNRDLLDRVAIILGIHQSLRLLFPNDRELAYAWIKTRNKALGSMPPVEVVTVHGFPGLLMVRSYLDRMRLGW